MSYFKGFFIIITCLFAGEISQEILPFPIPSLIYGMIYLFLLLVSGLVKIDDIEDTSNLLVANLSIMFVPLGVQLIRDWEILSEIIIPLLVIIIVSSFASLATIAKVIQWVQGKQKERRE